MLSMLNILIFFNPPKLNQLKIKKALNTVLLMSIGNTKYQNEPSRSPFNFESS
jgi:hypothetical protein